MGNKIDFCSISFPAALDQTRYKAGGYCKVCKMAISYIDGILEKNATEEQIEDAVRRVCSFLPDSYQTEVSGLIFLLCVTFTRPHVTCLALTPACLCPQCDQLIEQYEPMLIQLLLQMLDPDFVCMVNKMPS